MSESPLLPVAARPALLALDGATERLALALVHADGRRWCVDAEGGAQASAALLPLLRQLLERAGLDGARDLAGIAYGRGPGAFTGLRTICAVTQGLGLGWQLPVLELDSLALVAEAARQADAHWNRGWVVMDARMGELYAAPYAWDGRRWCAEAEPGLWTSTALLEHCRGQALAGSGLDLLGAAAATSPLALNPSARAAALAALAEQAWTRTEGADWRDAAQALPLYVRDKVALTSAERAAGQALP